MTNDKIWTADELEKMSSEERRAIFDASIVTDPNDVDPEFLERATARFKKFIKGREGIDD